MGFDPDALYKCLTSDLYRGLTSSDIELLESECSFTDLASPSLVARKFQLDKFLSKLKELSKKEQRAADREALRLFLAANQTCKEWRAPVPENDLERLVLGEFRQILSQVFEKDYGEIVDLTALSLQHARPGPGACIGMREADFYSKVYASDMTYTDSELYWLYYSNTLQFDAEQRAEVTRSAEFASCAVRGSKFGCVPKKRTVSRTICVEPGLNMMLQLGTGFALEELITEKFRLRLKKQPDANRELSRRGSIDGSYATIDLSSASDTISLGFLYWACAFVPEVFYWILWIRSPYTELPSGEQVRLHMVSSMGNGFTFPLMTLLFLCMVKAIYRASNIKLRYTRYDDKGEVVEPGNFGVFGDDIIVVGEVYDLTMRMLGYMGFTANMEKSFGGGPFRESCGHDHFRGVNVRAVFCKRVRKPQYRYTLINRLNAWSSEHDIALPDTISFLLKSVWWLPVPPWEAADSGVHVPFGYLKVRCDENRSYKYSAMRPIKTDWDPSKGLVALRGSTSGDGKLVLESSYVNSFGVILAAAGGYLRGGAITRRDDDPRFRKTSLVTPGWEFTGKSTCGFTTSGWARFDRTLAIVNMAERLC